MLCARWEECEPRRDNSAGETYKYADDDDYPHDNNEYT